METSEENLYVYLGLKGLIEVVREETQGTRCWNFFCVLACAIRYNVRARVGSHLDLIWRLKMADHNN